MLLYGCYLVPFAMFLNEQPQTLTENVTARTLRHQGTGRRLFLHSRRLTSLQSSQIFYFVFANFMDVMQ